MTDERHDDNRTLEEIASAVALDKAEAKKFLAEAEVHRQESLIKAAALRRELVAAEKAEIELGRERHKRDLELAANEFHHTYLFDKVVNDASVKACVTQMSQWTRNASEPLTIDLVINSPGGDVVEGFALIDFIESLHAEGHTINTSAYGMAASMGGVILQVGKTRSIGKNAVLLIHEAQFGAGGSYGEVEDRVKLVDIFHDRILSLFAARAAEINPKTTKAFIKRNWLRKNWWLSADQTVKLGFADKFADQ